VEIFSFKLSIVGSLKVEFTDIFFVCFILPASSIVFLNFSSFNNDSTVFCSLEGSEPNDFEELIFCSTKLGDLGV